MSSDLDFAIKLARETGQLLVRQYTDTARETRLKADRSVVTEADLKADRLIKRRLQNCYPGDMLLSEELQPNFAGGVENKLWIIDPLDGTTNFSLGLQFWGVLIARLVNGWPELGVMHFPLLEETYTAERGQGAYLNGKRIRVQPPDENTHASFFACCGRTHRRYEVRVPYKPRILGSAAYSLCAVARGMAITAFEATPKIWDIAAGWLLVREAGGIVETYDESEPFPLLTGEEYARKSFPTLAAANAALLKKTRGWLRPRE